MCNLLELSELFVCPGELGQFFSTWGDRKIAGLWFAQGDQYPDWHYALHLFGSTKQWCNVYSKSYMQQSYNFAKMLPYQTTEVLKYWCFIDFVCAYQGISSLARTGISFQNNLNIFKLPFDMQYWKYSNICITWKTKEKT